ncbi:MAG: hypothetical protein ACW98K_04070 [Candidatus Kariarchaeaceae archaeon]|jgi:hypothetical protein
MKMGRPLWFVQMLKKSFPQRFMLARLSHVPPIRWLMTRMFFHEDKMFYLPRTKTIQINKAVQRQQDTVLPTKVIDHFIEQSSKRWIMNFCICRSSDDCEKYPKE